MKLKRSALDPTAAERNHVAEATSRRRRILRSRILFYKTVRNSFLTKLFLFAITVLTLLIQLK